MTSPRPWLLLPVVFPLACWGGGVAAAPGSITRHQALVDRLEATHGAYGARLVEARLALGLAHQRAGDHAAALPVLRDAWQALRVNQGLYSMEQAAVLEAVIAANAALGDTAALRRNYQYLLWLHRRNQGERGAEPAAVAARIGQWYLDLYRAAPPASTVEPLAAADELYERALRRLPEDAPPGTRARLLYQAAVVNRHLAEDVQNPMLSHRQIRAAMLPHGRGNPYVNETAVRQYYAYQAFHKGRRALQEIVEMYEQRLPAALEEYVEALVFTGDWLTVQRRAGSGARFYQRARAVLAEHRPRAAHLAALLETPQPIEYLPPPGAAAVAAVKDGCYADALLDVPASGRPQNIRILAVHPPGHADLPQRARRAIAAVRYRPRFQAGRLAATADIRLRYVFRHKKECARIRF